MGENIFKLCLNLTNSNHSELQDCYEYNGTNENVTLEDTEHTVEEASNADLDRQIKYYCEGVILVPLAIFGLFANTLSIWILTSKGMRNCFNIQLAALAAFDMMFLFVQIIIFGLPKLSMVYQRNVLPWIMPVAFGFVHIGRVGSAFATVTVTVERFIAVMYPLKKLRNTRILLSVPIIGSLFYNIPRFFEFKTSLVFWDGGTDYFRYRNDTNITNLYTVAMFEATDLRKNPHYLQVYILWMKLALIEFIPYSIIIILNCITASKIMKSAHLRRMMSVAYTRNSRGDRNPNAEGFKRTEIKQAITLLWISVLYIACQSPKVIPDFYEAINCDYVNAGQCPLPSVIKIIIAVSNLLVAVNSTSNFFIYIWKGVQFRRQLQNKFTRRHHTSQYYNGPLHRNATTRATTRVTDVMEMNSVHQCCD